MLHGYHIKPKGHSVKLVDYGHLPDAVRILVDEEADEYWPQVEAELESILASAHNGENTKIDSLWRTLKEIESLPVCTHELQEGRLRITDHGLTGYLVCSKCGHPERELGDVTDSARKLNQLPRHAVTHGGHTDEVPVREYSTALKHAVHA